MAKDVSISGAEDLFKNMDRMEDDIRREAMLGLEKAGKNIIEDAQRNLRQDKINVTGVLSQSGKTQRVDDNTVEAGFIADNGNGYAEFVEYGRRSGRMPPPDTMGEWAYKKLRIRDRRIADRVGWALAKKIAKAGTKPHPFFQPAVEKNRYRIKDVVEQTVDKLF